MWCLKMSPNYSLLSLLAFSLLISFINLPTASTRAINVMHETPGVTLADEMALQVDQTVERRLDLEINRDYPGSGANNRHTPNPPVKE
ncbi:hypothetical protein SASPL_140330 [Salvia splendens]|uniref:Uncharacterized protein n=1 Tax=Salvia splendens TaxID=180675 RepID=A0A8X8WRR8_SALSN|nr:hypothetical protein SASPL_140330 [Salvia splendens]